MRSRWRDRAVPLVAAAAVLGSGAWLVTQESGSGFPGFSGVGGGSAVSGLADARERAESFAVRLSPDLRVGEVMRFANNFYAELEAPDGTLATEVLVDPRSGAVRVEFGPATMWNTRYGMMRQPDTGTRLSPDQADAVAQEWAQDRGDGLTVAEPDAFPGYYTLHTLRDGRVEGMLSVHAVTGRVWYHGWHGQFEEMSEDG